MEFFARAARTESGDPVIIGSSDQELERPFEILEHIESGSVSLVDELRARVIDQPEAMEAIAEALDRAQIKNMLGMSNRPVATFAFLGPTGVGKTETAKALADLLKQDGEPNLIIIDASSYSNGHEVATLTGSPPGYVGYDIKPMLRPATVEMSGTVILVDEVEKGSAELHNLLLQILDDGRLTTSRGQEVNFKDAIIILTSNIGAKEMADRLSSTPLGFNRHRDGKQVDRGHLEKIAREAFKRNFKPEFVNRLDKLVVFNSLTAEGLAQVLEAKISHIDSLLESKSGISLSLSPAVSEYLVDIALQEPDMGARPLMRAIDSQILATLGKYWDAGMLSEGTEVRVCTQSEVYRGVVTQSYVETLVFTKRERPSYVRQVITEEPETLPFEISSEDEANERY